MATRNGDPGRGKGSPHVRTEGTCLSPRVLQTATLDQLLALEE